MNLSEWLTRNKMSQSAFAAFAGISRQTVNNLLSGRCKPTLETATAIERETKGAVKAREWIAP